MPTRYDYECQNCGSRVELVRSMNSDPTITEKCPRCHETTLSRRWTMPTTALEAIDPYRERRADGSRIPHYSDRFPYVSNAMPFGGNLAGGGAHVGRMKKILVESAKHEERLRHVHGMSGEKDIGKQVHEPDPNYGKVLRD